MFLLACSGGTAFSEEIETVRSWDHYRELMIVDGTSAAESDARIAGMLSSLRSMDRSAGSDRIGVPAPSFEFDGWLNSEPLSLEDLRGQVVLVRWWTETCPFCASSAPALRAIDEQYSPLGLIVIGVYHPKADRDGPLDAARVERAVAARELDFPIAIDWDWRNGTLKDWWLTGPDRPATSVTFLLDKSGVIQFVHPGMEYHDPNGSEGHAMCAVDMAGIRSEIERLLAE
ncbi:MAG: redoxin domain-containing protein [Wenzhouxiangellaceae bacterium]|nr:redoxin domain-containing protein [Wenzhouxiangellaceae bacterium]MBS3824818.1 redoxin domain-containing protein [Wenzhouxiangellaceae bacterium]